MEEVKVPLTTSLMLLESLQLTSLGVQAVELIVIIISQINLVISSVNNMLDLRLIERRKFVGKREAFAPRNTFNFLIKMFEPMSKLQNNEIEFCAYSVLGDPEDPSDRMIKLIEEQKNSEHDFLPKKLKGDQIRLK